MDVNEKRIKKRLIAKRKNIKRKLDQLKQGKYVQEAAFVPITKHLKNIENIFQDVNYDDRKKTIIKDEIKEKSPIKLDLDTKNKQMSPKEIQFSEKPPIKMELEDYHETPKMPHKLKKQLSSASTPINLYKEDYNDFEDEPSNIKKSILESSNYSDTDETEEQQQQQQNKRFEDIAEKSFNDYLEQYDPLPRKYIRGMYNESENKDYDRKYGVRLDTTTEKLKIGNSTLSIVDSDIVVQNKRYKGTPGLYELLFLKKPERFTNEDKKNYLQIVKKTNAARRYYKTNKQVDGSKLKKYRDIIAPAVSGHGIFNTVTMNEIDYVHWDDPNELVDRLRLLLASQSAGHTGHINEINSIIEELKEAYIIA